MQAVSEKRLNIGQCQPEHAYALLMHLEEFDGRVNRFIHRNVPLQIGHVHAEYYCPVRQFVWEALSEPIEVVTGTCEVGRDEGQQLVYQLLYQLLYQL